ncbi:Glyoxylase, beta-lactamase superfamily II [Chitinophaga jiangningensis]|uniref:Glyoxylase, beta-lactamase superfamily II n=1 Tax=Chitinophaga jiangningensis TaxID=1419482 RepID=A0A1M6YCU4_9BACT|nr:MBL fold metallo-hydrolase [Chitinophaga jiangningensis]SHL16107.1 Glyoxylase, beta-lactamase superfamily II [Chitinophaga jiangningensis]
MAKIHHLNCVDIQSPAGGGAIGHCLLLETASKLVLIDTGIGLLDTQQPEIRIGRSLIDRVGYRFNEALTAVRQIEQLGLSPEIVTDCIISHLDNDHIGGLADFPEAVVHVSLEEYENYQSGNPRYITTPLLHHPQIITYAPSANKWLSFEARKIQIDIDFDIYLIPLFGHTNGHCGVAIQDGDQWLLYVADAYYLRAELTELHHPINQLAKMNADNDDLRMESLDKVRKLVEEHPEIEVFGYHDREEFDNCGRFAGEKANNLR